ncbi:polyketide synthase [Mycolicibacterium chitae]|nr:hypothetical protein [Mycolicibacterium chitae]MCV7105805.1 hypothetical protein [Mycolicibacterium chitae]BBZ04650.1 polyketide synthase [Mycolicibacterium chitae]
MPATSLVRSAAPARHRTDDAQWLTDRWVDPRPKATDMAKLASRLDPVLTAEVTSPGVAGGAAFELILVAALGRAIARTVGSGALIVELDGEQSSRRRRLECSDLRGPVPADPLAAVTRADTAVAGQAWVSYRSTVSGTTPPEGHLLALHARRGADVIYLNWWYDTRSFDRHTVEEFDEQLPLVLIEVVSS